MVWLLTNMFGYSEGSALIRAPHCWIILLGCTAIFVLLFSSYQFDRIQSQKHRKIHENPRHTVRKREREN